MLLRFGLAAGGNFADVAVIGTAGAVEHDEGTGHAFQIPVLHRNRVHVLDEETANAGNLLFRLPNFISVEPLRLEIDGL